MKHIYQRGTHDCGVAALAMFTDHTYEEMLEMCLKPSRDDDPESLPVFREGWGYEPRKRYT